MVASPTQWTWVWVNSRSWWWTGRPGVLQSMGSQRHDWMTELNWHFNTAILLQGTHLSSSGQITWHVFPVLTDVHWYGVRVCVQSLSCVQLCYPMDCSPPGSSVYRVFQAGILEWGTISSSRGSSWPRDRTLHWQADSIPTAPLGKPMQ